MVKAAPVSPLPSWWIKKINMERQIEAVIFDLGGTLIEYAGSYLTWPELETPGLEAAYQYLEDKEVPLPPFNSFLEALFTSLPGRWQGATDGKQNLRLADFLAELLAENNVDGLPEEWIVEAARAYQDTICRRGELIEGALETLTVLKEQGYKLGLLSNTMFEGSAHVADLQRFNLEAYFDAVLFSADLNMWKPSPAPYNYLLDQLETAPTKAVFVGDSPVHDIVGGKGAGMAAIWFQSTDRFGEPDGVQPDATVHQLTDLPPLLAGWNRV
jgi:HAD superfamily hydrolase (TIGR01662 family)